MSVTKNFSAQVFTVGAGKQFATIREAVAGAHAAGAKDAVFKVDAGLYANDGAAIRGFDHVTIEGVGGIARFIATGQAPDGKGIFTVDNSATFENVELAGAQDGSLNGAGIRLQAGDLVVRNAWIHDNQEGILASPYQEGTGSVLIESSEIGYNAFAGGGQAHNLYIGRIASFTIRDSYIHDSSIGHEIKSRAVTTLIENNRIQNNDTGTGSYNVDLPNGGNAVIRGNVIQQSNSSDNTSIITFGIEGNAWPNSNLLVENNTIVNDKTNHYATYVEIVANAIPGAITVADNRLWTSPEMAVVPKITGWWPQGGEFAIGAERQTGNTRLDVRPTMDTRHVASLGLHENIAGSGPDTLVLRLSENLFLGNGVTVDDPSQPWSHAAFRVSVDGTALNEVQFTKANHAKSKSTEFTYKGDFGSGQHAVAIQFLNKDWNAAGGEGRDLWVDSVTLNNVPVSVALGGTMQSGYNTVQVYVAPVNASLPTGSSSNPAPVPNPDPVPLVVGQGPDAFIVSVSGDEWQGNAQFAVMVDGQQFGSTMTAIASHTSGQSQDVQVLGTFGDGPHRVAVQFLNDAYGGTSTTDRNLYVDSIHYNSTLVPKSSATMLSNGVTTFSVPPSALAPALDVVLGEGLDAFVLKISEDAYLGDAQFMLSVDGQRIGGVQTATVLHGEGESQTFTVKGEFDEGSHKIEVQFLNDAYGGTSMMDRNLHVDAVSYNGIDLKATSTLWSAGSASFDTPANTPTPALDSLKQFLADFAAGIHTGHFSTKIGAELQAAIPELEHAFGANPQLAQLYESLFTSSVPLLDSLAHTSR